MVSVTEKEFWFEFIDQYRSMPCLWNIYIPEYCNRQMREEALEELVEKCKEIHSKANKDFVRKRIASLRTAFGREFRKISKGRGFSTTDNYRKPSLWYYHKLLFLMDNGIMSKDRKSSGENAADDFLTPPDTLEESSSTNSNSPKCTKRKKLSLDQKIKNKIEKTKKAAKDDEFDILGKKFGSHFRNMEPQQRVIAEKIISDVLISGTLNQLNLNSTLVLYPDPPETKNLQPAFGFHANIFQPHVNHSTETSNNVVPNQYAYYTPNQK